MFTKTITERVALAETLAETITTQTEVLNQELNQLLTPYLQEGETVPDLTFLQELLNRHLETNKEEIHRTNLDNHAEQAESTAARFARVAEAETCSRLLSRVRGYIETMYGREFAQNFLTLNGETSRNPISLRSQVETVLEKLRQPDSLQPVEGFDIDPLTWANQLEEAMNRMRSAERRFKQASRGLFLARAARRRRLSDFDLCYRGLARTYQGLFLMLRKVGEAERVRPRLVDRGGSPETEPDETGAAPTPDGGGTDPGNAGPGADSGNPNQSGDPDEAAA